jgi:TatD DNase family protein
MSKKHKHNRQEPETLGLPRVGVDSHAHMDMEDFDPDRTEILDRALASGVARTGNVFLGPAAYHANRHLFNARPEVFFLLGIHPGNADTCTPEAVEAMRLAFAGDARLKAVGEIGLDYYWNDHPREVQAIAFRAQLDMARTLGLPPVIHCRDAFDDCVAQLAAAGFSGEKLLWHCFGGGPAQAEILLGHGWTLSIPGPVTYSANAELQAAVGVIPLSRLVLETDSPYLSAEPWRGKRNHPALTAFTARRVAELKGLDIEEVWAAAGNNARAFFNLEDI